MMAYPQAVQELKVLLGGDCQDAYPSTCNPSPGSDGEQQLEAYRDCVTDHKSINWCTTDLSTVQFPKIALRAFDYATAVRRDADLGGADLYPIDGLDQGADNFITLSRIPAGEEVNSMDGWAGISKQVIRVSAFSIRRIQVTTMINAIHDKLNGYTGRPRSDGAEIQMCLLDDAGDIYEEESDLYALDMFFMVIVSY